MPASCLWDCEVDSVRWVPTMLTTARKAPCAVYISRCGDHTLWVVMTLLFYFLLLDPRKK